MKEYTPHQQRIIRNYYRNRERLALQKLQELVGDLYLAGGDRERERLWKRVEKAFVNLKVPPRLAEHILTSRRPELLAEHVKEWWERMPGER